MIIETLLDTDFYKLTMQQATLHQFPGTQVEYAFRCRTPGVVWTEEIVRDINTEIDFLCDLRFKPYELMYLCTIPWLKHDYIDFLSLFQLNRNHIKAWLNVETGKLEIRIKGNWFLTILFEVPVLAIVSEVYYRHTYPDLYGKPKCFDLAEPLLRSNISLLYNSIHISEFGTRRRFWYEWQRRVVSLMYKVAPRECCVGTSNVEIARSYGVRPIGTMGHEWIQAGQAVGVKLIDSQKRMLQAWVDEYRGQLGIALSDTLGVDAFIKDFDPYFAKLYDGVRQDSGDPIEWGEKIIQHYKDFRIDPTTKTLLFTDSLSIPRAIEIYEHFKERAKISFGIGTKLANDIPGVTPLNIVIKMVKCNGQPVAKLSDSPGKMMCEDQSYVDYLKSVFGIKG